MSLLVVVTCRAPIILARRSKGWVVRTAYSSVIGALHAVLGNRQGAVWVGWPMAFSAKLQRTKSLWVARGSYRCRLLLPAARHFRSFRDKFCDGFLWAYLHSMPQHAARVGAKHWRAYREMNAAYARAVLDCAESQLTSHVWVHDYHLMLVPARLRQLGYRGRIGFFLHVPFPAPELVETMPHIGSILRSLLSADSLAFQTTEYCRNFLQGANKVLGARICENDRVLRFDGRNIRVRVAPIGIPRMPTPLIQNSSPPAIDTYDTKGSLDAISAWSKSPTRLLSAERLDYIKGITERLKALHIFLEQSSHYRGRMTLLQFIVRCRRTLRSYRDEWHRVLDSIDRINGRFGSAHWLPVHTVWGATATQVAANYPRAHIAMVTPLRDGMNLVAKEYAAAGPVDGVLILSRFAGAAEKLGRWSILVDPREPNDVAESLKAALAMPAAERRERKRQLAHLVHKEDVLWWARRCLSALR